jgi:hypothetical protein
MSGKAPRSTIFPVAASAGGAPRTSVATTGSDLRHVVGRIGKQASNVWLPGIKWRIERTGRPGVAGLVLLGASAIFLFSTHLPVADEVARLRSDLLEAQTRVANAPQTALSEPVKALQGMPARTEMPQVLGIILKQAGDAQLNIDTAKYEISTTKVGGLVRYRLSFPIDGPYPNVRRFIDSTLVAIPALAIDDLSITRKSISDNAVEAQVRMTIFTRGAP